MTRDDTFVEQLENYLDEYEGLTPLPDLVRDDVRAALPSTNQVGPMPGLRRYFPMSLSTPARLAAGSGAYLRTRTSTRASRRAARAAASTGPRAGWVGPAD